MVKKQQATARLATSLTLTCCCLIIVSLTNQPFAKAQDILRQQRQQPQPPNQQQQHGNIINNNNNPLANIQLPPELAALTPQQLHQLAQLREMQLQQQATQQQGNTGSTAPAPIGAEHLSSTTPAASGTQISQPTASSSTDSNDRHDDGAYNESGSEMEGVMQSGGDGSASSNPTSSSSSSSASEASQATANAPGGSGSSQAAPTFEVNWNKCPQLEPSESEKNKKTQVITKCLQSAPIPTNLTRENVETHREQIATCALRVEGWFDEQGNYKYDKAEAEIRGKKLESGIELQVLKFHVACKDEASKKFPRDQNKLIDQVQFYQACMDYYISIVCEIEVSVDQ